ncbi:MAG TPA: HAMP domain-containing sensor histidine kinase [Chitinophagaceae bacterium]|nr:HAMP domain-containing sensor histidine kinase [Chitinophagaceae bacterium]
MKLLNQSLKYLSVSLLFVVSLWAVVFYFNMLNEIKESMDEGLENYKRQIIYKVQTDTTILHQNNFEEGFFAIHPVPRAEALSAKDRYTDTLMYMQDADDEAPELEPVRMLSTVFEQGGLYYRLDIINSMVEEDDLIKELFREAIGLYLVLIAGLILINRYVLQRLWHPFYSLLEQLKGFRLGSNKPFPIVTTKTKEFSDLQQAVKVLLQHSTERYEQQKEFIGNAAHELQTPLAIATNKLELMLEKGNFDEAQAEGIAAVMQIIERLVRLNKSLLLLTKIENKQFLNDESIPLHKLVQQSVSDLEEMAAFRKISISLPGPAILFATMDNALATIIVSNLVRNALFHNVASGMIQIEITGTTMKICNSGQNEPLLIERLFNRFYKSGAQQAGTGLGLAIVKAICDLYGFSIAYDFTDGLHCFTVDFSPRH